MDAREYLESIGITIDEGTANTNDGSDWINSRMVIEWLEGYHQSKENKNEN